MINSIIEAISISLHNEFGDTYGIYTEEIEQDLQEPCFFIVCLNSATKLCMGKRYFKQNQFSIQYFSKSEEIQRECNEIAERLVWSLECITLDGEMIRGTNMKYEVVDGILKFVANYDCFVYRIEENTLMESMGSGTNVKEGD